MVPGNRRRHPRHPHDHPALVERLPSGGGTFALTRDLSLEGFALQSPEPLAEQETVRAIFLLDHDYLVAEGRVTWARRAEGGRYECGIEFTRMDPVHRAMVRRALEMWELWGTVH